MKSVNKGDEAKVKKKNKAIRKKLNRDPAAAVSARVAAIIAAKKRRHTGKRRQCQGMCFSLPTPQDPFNDRRGKDKDNDDTATKQTNKKDPKPKPNNKGKVTTSLVDGEPSKYLFNCLNTIRESLAADGGDYEEKSYIGYSWGYEFWKCFTLGKDVLDSSVCVNDTPCVQQIAWIASTAADAFQRSEDQLGSEEEVVVVNTPFLLYLVPSHSYALKVRSFFKPLKVVGIHTVCLHSESSLEHQVNGLKSCDPEFVIATPERLWELVTLKEFDISSVTLLVVDAVDSLSNFLDVVERIKESISGEARTLVFQGRCIGSSSIPPVKLQRLVKKPVTLSVDASKSR